MYIETKKGGRTMQTALQKWQAYISKITEVNYDGNLSEYLHDCFIPDYLQELEKLGYIDKEKELNFYGTKITTGTCFTVLKDEFFIPMVNFTETFFPRNLFFTDFVGTTDFQTTLLIRPLTDFPIELWDYISVTFISPNV